MERLVVLQDLLELQRELEEEGGLERLEEMGFALGSREAVLAEVESGIEAVRAEIPPAVLRRFESVARKYRRPVAPLRNGTCYGCFTRLPTARGDDAGPVRSCPNCGRLVYEI
jgi:predicted  nucleic acid-binding Zn-ribbon protein